MVTHSERIGSTWNFVFLSNYYTSKGAPAFIYPLLLEYQQDYPDINIYLRGDSGFADVMFYEKLESNGVTYAIRMKESGCLRSAADELESELIDLTKENQLDYAVVYGEFMYKADSWLYPRRIAVKIEKPYGQMIHRYTFIVTKLLSGIEKLIFVEGLNGFG